MHSNYLRRLATGTQEFVRQIEAAAGIEVKVELDPSQFRVTRAGAEIVLTSREFAVLHVLIKEPGRVVSAERLLELAWDDQADPFTAAVRVIMSRLRAKLGQPSLIETVVGRGYRLVA